ncbi:ABC transporter substrate-binding protein [Telmatospirillum sp.]|uniref:ABC transporter substrate-binding protein n=1 Tax=Telmatospirillum sp. TaxID=2079197 RepID=UPI002842CAB2|nr:ABC transporter substrate-binding protein [Telmatospirillum sp.]MDR3439835.1 ABC transporter substrate-binding protein [Telmatospirillum sp.]
MRPVLKLAFAALGLCSVAVPVQAEDLNFSSWGGSYQDAIRKAWLEPFGKSTGVKIVEDTNPEVAKIKAMIDTNTVEWDVVTENGVRLARGISLGLFEPVGKMVDVSHVIAGARNDYGVPSEIFSTNLAFSTKAFPDGKPQPKSFKDFWDVEKFPGKRTMQDDPSAMLEAALLADGVPLDKVYSVLSTKEGLDRAFAMVAKIKPHITIFWHNGAQPVQLLGSGEVVMAIGWNGRFQSGIDDGLPIRMSWDQIIANIGYFTIPKKAPHKDTALKFLSYMVGGEPQSRFSNYVAYGPVTEDAWPFIDDKRKERLPSTPERIKNALFVDYAWWGQNADKLTERYTQLLQQ